MKVQQTIKKVGAVAASTLMVGMTMGAAQSLSDFPGMFTDDDGTPTAEIVVGSEGQVADVVGAVNVAAALGQETIQTEEMTETVEGASTTSVDGNEYEAVIGSDLGSAGENPGETLDASDYSGLMRDTVTVDGDEHQVVERIGVDSGASTSDGGVSTSVTNIDGDDYFEAGNVVTELDAGAVSYEVSYTPGIPENETLQMLGNEYQITSVVDDTELEIGSEMTHENLEVGDTVSQGPFTVEVAGFDSENSRVRVTVSEDGERLDSATLEDGESATFGDEDEFTVRADSVFFGDTTTDVILDTVYTESSLEEGEDFPWDDRYTVASDGIDTDGDSVTGITLENQVTTSMPADDEDESDLNDDQILPLHTGDSFTGPLDYFSVIHQGMTEEATNDFEFGEAHEVTFDDANAFETTLPADELVGHAGTTPPNVESGDDLSSQGASEDWYVGVPDEDADNYYPVQITSWDSNADSDITLEYQNWDYTFSTDNSDAEWSDLGGATTSYTHASAAESGSNVTVAYEEVSTGYGFSVTVEWVSNDGNAGAEALNVYGSDYDTSQVQDGGSQPADSDAHAQVTSEFGANVHISESSVGQFDSASPADNENVVQVDYTEADTSSDTIDVHYAMNGDHSEVDQDEIAGIEYDSDGSDGDDNDDELGSPSDGQEVFTGFGSHVNLGGTSSATVELPEDRRHVEHAVGEMTESAGEDQTVEYEGVSNPDIRGTLDDMSMLDSEVTQSVRDSSDLILVGGPAVNTLVQDLANDGDTWTADNWRNNHQDEALVQLVEDAFTDGQHALIVAGYQAQDTRAAANYISNYAEHADELEGETQVTMTRGEYPGQ